jgi:acetyltransferase-like isoleucine patch superfamily enzyme
MIDDFESKIFPLSNADPRIDVGRFTYGAPNFKLWEECERVTIGAFCSIADEVVIFGGGEHRADWVTTFPLRIAFGDPLAGQDGHPATKGPTEIGNDVWIGYGATILSGVKIGDGAVIGARALVSRDVAPYSIVAGNPAQKIKMRFEDVQIAALLHIRWWEWPTDKIAACQAQLCGGNIDAFIAAHLQL